VQAQSKASEAMIRCWIAMLCAFATGYAASWLTSSRAQDVIEMQSVLRLVECRESLDQAAERLCLADIALGPCWETAAWYQQAYLNQALRSRQR
jgi:hypothetical protein